MVPEYTVLAVAAVVGVAVAEVRAWRDGLFRSPSYWVTMGISFAFMVLVDGWLTKLSAPIVLYDPDHILRWRAPWDIPVEDYLFGWALLTWVLARWRRLGDDGGWAPRRR